jgi:hypothetical protein
MHKRGVEESGEEEGTSCTLSLDFEKLGHENPIKLNLPRFSHNPVYLLKRIRK